MTSVFHSKTNKNSHTNKEQQQKARSNPISITIPIWDVWFMVNGKFKTVLMGKNAVGCTPVGSYQNWALLGG